MYRLIVILCLWLFFFFLLSRASFILFFSFFFNDTATTEIYTLSLHDALPILLAQLAGVGDADRHHRAVRQRPGDGQSGHQDRKSTRLNSSHQIISYAVFCLKKKKKQFPSESKKVF